MCLSIESIMQNNHWFDSFYLIQRLYFKRCVWKYNSLGMDYTEELNPIY